MESWITIHEISKYLSKPDKKFVADITYGMLASGSCLLTDVVDAGPVLNEMRAGLRKANMP